MYCDEESDTETCQAMETARDIDLIEDRPDWCPLRELPEKKELKNDLIRIAEENWTDSQVKMLKGLICAAVNGIEYSDAYEVVNRD